MYKQTANEPVKTDCIQTCKNRLHTYLYKQIAYVPGQTDCVNVPGQKSCTGHPCCHPCLLALPYVGCSQIWWTGRCSVVTERCMRTNVAFDGHCWWSLCMITVFDHCYDHCSVVTVRCISTNVAFDGHYLWSLFCGHSKVHEHKYCCWWSLFMITVYDHCSVVTVRCMSTNAAFDGRC